MKCPVCKNNTFDENDYQYHICEECFWEYDIIQVENPDYDGGANKHSLNEYRKIYEEMKLKKLKFSCKNVRDRKSIIKFDNDIKNR